MQEQSNLNKSYLWFQKVCFGCVRPFGLPIRYFLSFVPYLSFQEYASNIDSRCCRCTSDLQSKGCHLDFFLTSNQTDRFVDINKGRRINRLDSFFLLMIVQQRQSQLEMQWTQFKDSQQKLSKNADNLVEQQFIRKRIEIFRSLMAMCEQGRINVLDIEDDFDRDDILQRYLSEESIKKEYYEESMKGNYMIRQFSNEVSTTAHTWNKLILEPYLEQLPVSEQKVRESVLNLQKERQLNSRELAKVTNRLQNQNQALELQERKLQAQKLEFQRIARREYTVEQENLLQSNLQIVIPDYFDEFQSQITHCREFIQNESQEIKQIEHQIETLTQSIEQLQDCKSQQSATYDSNLLKLDSWKEGFINDVIINYREKLGQEVSYGKDSYTKKQRLEYISRGQELPEFQYGGSFKTGQKHKRLCKIIKIERQYSILPSQQFDPHQYIQKDINQFGKYLATTSSKGYELEGAKLDNYGKTLLLSVSIDFPITEKEQDLPYLEITHTMPKAEHYQAAIKNLQAQNREIQKKCNDITIRIVASKRKISKLKTQIRQSQLQIAKKERFIKKLEQQNQTARDNKGVQLRTNKIAERAQQLVSQKNATCQQIKKDIEFIKENIIDSNRLLMKTNKSQEEIQSCIKAQTQSLHQIQLRLRRFRLLIKGQLQKNVPQAMRSFIKVAKQMCEKVLESGSIQEKNKEAALMKLINFNKFLANYSKIQQLMLEIFKDGDKDQLGAKKTVATSNSTRLLQKQQERQTRTTRLRQQQQEKELKQYEQMKKKIKSEW